MRMSLVPSRALNIKKKINSNFCDSSNCSILYINYFHLSHSYSSVLLFFQIKVDWCYQNLINNTFLLLTCLKLFFCYLSKSNDLVEKYHYFSNIFSKNDMFIIAFNFCINLSKRGFLIFVDNYKKYVYDYYEKITFQIRKSNHESRWKKN